MAQTTQIASNPSLMAGGCVRNQTTVYEITGNEVTGDYVVVGELPRGSQITDSFVHWEDCASAATALTMDIGTSADVNSVVAGGSLAAAGSDQDIAVVVVPAAANEEIRLSFLAVTGVTYIVGAKIFVNIQITDWNT